MTELTGAVLILVAVLWPLLLVGAMAFRTTRRGALRLAPWATLPALIAAVAPVEQSAQLPGVLMRSALVLDDTGRGFLLLSAGLWLATGLLSRPLLNQGDGSRFGMLLLLAGLGGVVSSLATDAVMFFTGSTVCGYALYGLLFHRAEKEGLRAGRVLVILLVLSDVVVFELLLTLSQSAGGVDFATLSQGFADPDTRGLMFLLLVAGPGIKTGLVGLHYWLVPVIATSRPDVRPALIGFMYASGLHGWLRLVPIEFVPWPAAGASLKWLAWLALAYAVIAGISRAQSRSVLAYLIMAVTGLWLAVLGFGVDHPQAWFSVVDVVQATILTAGFGLAAILTFDRQAVEGLPPAMRQVYTGLARLAAVTVSIAIANMAGSIAPLDGSAALIASSISSLVAFLVLFSLKAPWRASSRADHPGRHGQSGPWSTGTHAPLVLLVASGLTAAAVAIAVRGLAVSPPPSVQGLLLPVLAGVLAAWAIPARFATRLSTFFPGNALSPVRRGLEAILERGNRVARVRLPAWGDWCRESSRQIWFGTGMRERLRKLESNLGRFSVAALVLLVVGGIAALLG